MRKTILALSCILAGFIATTIAKKEFSKPSFTLLMPLYNEPNLMRVSEYMTCLEKNLNNPCIDSIHIFYDTSRDKETESPLLSQLQELPLTLHLIDGRASYGDFFSYANQFPHGSKVILANADIYFDESLNKFGSFPLHDVFVALTRWNILPDGSSKLHRIDHSQDTWIFETPLKAFNKDSIQLGVPHCDWMIAQQAHDVGLKVINPCLSIKTYHVHLSAIRNYTTTKRYPISQVYRLKPSYLAC